MFLISFVVMRNGVFLDGWISRTLLCLKVMTNAVCPISILFTEAVKYTLCTNILMFSRHKMNASNSTVTLDFCLILKGTRCPRSDVVNK